MTILSASLSPSADHGAVCSPKAGAPLGVARPLLPTADALAPYLARIDEARWYTNHGPLALELEERFAQLTGNAHVICASSGTAALTAVMAALSEGRTGPCVMPAWTFAATPAAALQAGQSPYFLDVDAQTWALDPAATAARASALEASSIIAVSPFGAPLPIADWAQLAQNTNIPVVVDAAAGMDSVLAHGTSGLPTVVSLHATKALGAGEGGLLFLDDAALAQEVRRRLNFGFYGDRVARAPGFNGKMSEYCAAVGHASLDAWEERRTAWRTAHARLRVGLSRFSCLTFGPDASGMHATATFNVLTPLSAELVISALAQSGVNAVRWWGAGCADQPCFAACERDDLPVTSDLAEHAVGLPMAADLSAEDVTQITAALDQALAGLAPPSAPVKGARAFLADLRVRLAGR